MQTTTTRYDPYDIEIEQALLGAILADNSALDLITGAIRPEHFYDPFHGRIFETIMAMVERDGANISPLTLHTELKTDPGLVTLRQTAGAGFNYLEALAAAAPIVKDIKQLSHTLVDLWTRRGFLQICRDGVAAVYEAPKDVSTKGLIEDAEKGLYGLAENAKFGQRAVDFEEALQRTIDQAQLAQSRGSKISGVTSGFSDIDQILGGLQPSDLLILAGRPGMGKTALGTNIAFHTARRYLWDIAENAPYPSGAAVLFFSLEMAAQQLSARILSEQTDIEMWKIRNGRFSEDEWAKFILRSQELRRLPLHIDDSGGVSIAQIAARARRYKREKNIGLFIIDYLQLVEPSRRHENRVQEITEVTKGLKTLAKELNVPILALSQLSRGVDNREDKRPVLSDLRESGSIEQDADVVMFVYREEYYLKTREPDVSSPEHLKWSEKMDRARRRAEVLIEKHRHGATGVVDLYFDDKFTRFSNLSE